jgi:hypothetical protein
VQQPVPFDHRHHVRDDGIDCLYCHYEAPRSKFAGVPPTSVCMGCHGQVWQESDRLAPLRASWFDGEPLHWRHVHRLPDFVYFDRSAHVGHGVGCVECHGRVDQMAAVYAVAPLTMQWCLDCHRDPDPHLRPESEITGMGRPPEETATRSRRRGARQAEGRPLCQLHGLPPMSVDRPWRGPDDRRGADGPTPEFPPGADAPPAVSRRDLLHLLGAGAALAGSTGCSRGPARDIVPYVNQPPEVTPSVATGYATTMSLDGYGTGMIVESHEGRPTKAEGNPLHPASKGALGIFGQACVLDLYDPGRARAPTCEGVEASWHAFVDAVTRPPAPGKKTHVLLEPTSSPHLIDLVERVRTQGAMAWFYAPLGRSNTWAGARLAFGRIAEPRWSFARTELVLALDADFLGGAHTPVPWARAWAERRTVRSAWDAMSRLYVVEARLSIAGMAADERLRVQARQDAGVAADLLAQVLSLVPDGASADARAAAATRLPLFRSQWTSAAARDLVAHRGASLVIAGEGQPPEVHAVAHALNEVLGNVGRTVTYGRSPVYEAAERATTSPPCAPRSMPAR